MQNMNIRTSQGGFTLIELVIVIVVLGILAAVAVPRYIDLTSEAEDATCQGIKGALSSTGAILIADSSVGGVGTPGTQSQILSNTVQDGWSATAGGGTCDFDVTLSGGGTCNVAIDSSLCT